MGILEMDFERILGVPFFHSSFHTIMLCSPCSAKRRASDKDLPVIMPNETFSQKFHPYSILSTKKKYESVAFCVLSLVSIPN